MTYRERLEAARERDAKRYVERRHPIEWSGAEQDAFASAAAPRDALIEKLAEALERVARGHTITKYIGGGLNENPDGLVKTKVEILVTPETEFARQALSELERFLAQGEVDYE